MHDAPEHFPSAGPGLPEIHARFDPATFTISYLVVDPDSRDAAVVDPVLDFDPRSGRVSDASARALLDLAGCIGARIRVVLETHVHADHISAGSMIRAETGAEIWIGERVREVQGHFSGTFGADDVSGTGAEFDRLVADGDSAGLGGLDIQAIATPGHTPACTSWRIGPRDVFVGDTIFMPDYGTARCDFPGGNAMDLYGSIQRLLALPADTRLWMCHDYKAPGRDHTAWLTSVAGQRAGNAHVRTGIDADAFVAARHARDRDLAAPVLLLPSVQTNMRAGRLPPADAEGRIFLRWPVSGHAAIPGLSV